jgi:hypothetical protein
MHRTQPNHEQPLENRLIADYPKKPVALRFVLLCLEYVTVFLGF